MNLPPSSVNIFDSVKITRVWSLADQCDSKGPPCQSSHENNVSCQQSLSSEKLPFPPLSDDKCLQLLNQSVITTKMFENYLGRAKRKERERSKRCEVKKWWLTGKKFSNKKLTCSKCNRGFHKAFGLEVHIAGLAPGVMFPVHPKKIPWWKMPNKIMAPTWGEGL